MKTKKSKINKNETTMFLVTEGWLRGLLKEVEKLEKLQNNYEYGENRKNDNFALQAATMTGFAKSASFILEVGEKVVR